MQQEDKLFKLDRFSHEEFEANLSVIRHIKMERLQEENDRDFGGGIGAYLAPSHLDDNPRARDNLNAISEDASVNSESKMTSYVGSASSPGIKPGARLVQKS